MQSNASDVRIILKTISGGPAGVSARTTKTAELRASPLPDSQPSTRSTGGNNSDESTQNRGSVN